MDGGKRVKARDRQKQKQSKKKEKKKTNTMKDWPVYYTNMIPS